MGAVDSKTTKPRCMDWFSKEFQPPVLYNCWNENYFFLDCFCQWTGCLVNISVCWKFSTICQYFQHYLLKKKAINEWSIFIYISITTFPSFKFPATRISFRWALNFFAPSNLMTCRIQREYSSMQNHLCVLTYEFVLSKLPYFSGRDRPAVIGSECFMYNLLL